MTGIVYAIQGVSGGPIKIGYTARSVADRIKIMQTGYPDKLVCVDSFSGDEWDERALHAHLAAHRLHGEWFTDTPAVREAFSSLAADKPLPVGPRTPAAAKKSGCVVCALPASERRELLPQMAADLRRRTSELIAECFWMFDADELVEAMKEAAS